MLLSLSQEFQREIVKAAEAFTTIGLRHIEAGTYMSLLFCAVSDSDSDYDTILWWHVRNKAG